MRWWLTIFFLFQQLSDFKSGNGFTCLAYGYLFISLTISLAVYAVDTFTAVQLLVFNKWSGEIQPAISFDVAKWIFSVCIILSFVNLGYEHIRAQLIIRRGSVAESYLDNLAVRLQSVRIFNGKGWRRFLVFAELTKSKKGAEYIALFTYFSFQGWSNHHPDCIKSTRLTGFQHGSASFSAPGPDKSSTLLRYTRCTMPNSRSMARTSSPAWRVSLIRSKHSPRKMSAKPSFFLACSSPSSFGSSRRYPSSWPVSSSSSSFGVGFPRKTAGFRDTAREKLTSG